MFTVCTHCSTSVLAVHKQMCGKVHEAFSTGWRSLWGVIIGVGTEGTGSNAADEEVSEAVFHVGYCVGIPNALDALCMHGAVVAGHVHGKAPALTAVHGADRFAAAAHVSFWCSMSPFNAVIVGGSERTDSGQLHRSCRPHGLISRIDPLDSRRINSVAATALSLSISLVHYQEMLSEHIVQTFFPCNALKRVSQENRYIVSMHSRYIGIYGTYSRIAYISDP